VTTAPYGSLNPTPHSQGKNRRRALIVRRHQVMLARMARLERAAATDNRGQYADDESE
jgi:hypothetical protein